MFNQCQFIGNLAADPEIKSFQQGGRIANFRIGVGEKWKDKNTGELKERTEWISVVVNNDGLIGVIERYIRKGSKVFVSGKLRTRKWQDQSGNDRYSTEVVLGGFDAKLVMLSGKPEGQSQDQQRNDDWNAGSPTDFDPLDDDVPF